MCNGNNNNDKSNINNTLLIYFITDFFYRTFPISK